MAWEPTTWLVATPLLLLAGGALWVSPLAVKRFQQSRLARRCRRERCLVLSYDDGPGALTPRLLDVLRTEGVRATFFLKGDNAEASPEVAQRIVAEGHDIGSHSYSHLHAWKANPLSVVADIRRGVAVCRTWQDSDLFRPPHGKLNIVSWLYVLFRRFRLGWWTIVSGDTYTPLPATEGVVRRLVEDGGGVVLLHDMHTDGERQGFVEETTRALIAAARKEGLSIRPLSDLLSGETGGRA